MCIVRTDTHTDSAGMQSNVKSSCPPWKLNLKCSQSLKPGPLHSFGQAEAQVADASPIMLSREARVGDVEAVCSSQQQRSPRIGGRVLGCQGPFDGVPCCVAADLCQLGKSHHPAHQASSTFTAVGLLSFDKSWSRVCMQIAAEASAARGPVATLPAVHGRSCKHMLPHISFEKLGRHAMPKHKMVKQQQPGGPHSQRCDSLSWNTWHTASTITSTNPALHAPEGGSIAHKHAHRVPRNGIGAATQAAQPGSHMPLHGRPVCICFGAVQALQLQKQRRGGPHVRDGRLHSSIHSSVQLQNLNLEVQDI